MQFLTAYIGMLKVVSGVASGRCWAPSAWLCQPMGCYILSFGIILELPPPTTFTLGMKCWV